MFIASEVEKETVKELSLNFSLTMNFAIHDPKPNTFSIPNRAVVIKVRLIDVCLVCEVLYQLCLD